MPVRLRKFIGTILLIVLVVLYALIATTVASARLAESSWVVHLAYFAISGVVWIVPAMALIKWMAGPVAKPDGR